MIRTDCYLVKLKAMRQRFPGAHFEVVTNASRNILAPSAELLVATGIFTKPDGTKNPRDFVLYRRLYREQIFSNKDAVKRLYELKRMAEHQDVFLVCFERDPTNCHRTLIKEFIQGLPDEYHEQTR